MIAWRFFFYSLAIPQVVVFAADSIIIKTLEGDGAINNIRIQRAKEPVIRVETESGAPISGAFVHFSAPTGGPGGVFLGGSANLTIQTDREGHARATGFRPNRNPGQFQIRVTVSHLGQTASARITQTNAEPSTATGMSSKKLALFAIVGGAVAGGAALAARGGGKSTPAAASPTAGTVISSGTPSFGAP